MRRELNPPSCRNALVDYPDPSLEDLGNEKNTRNLSLEVEKPQQQQDFCICINMSNIHVDKKRYYTHAPSQKAGEDNIMDIISNNFLGNTRSEYYFFSRDII